MTVVKTVEKRQKFNDTEGHVEQLHSDVSGTVTAIVVVASHGLTVTL